MDVSLACLRFHFVKIPLRLLFLPDVVRGMCKNAVLLFVQHGGRLDALAHDGLLWECPPAAPHSRMTVITAGSLRNSPCTARTLTCMGPGTNRSCAGLPATMA